MSEAHIGTEVEAWCNPCGRLTRHRVDRVAVGSHAGKVGPCLEHGPKGLTKAQEKRREVQRKKEQQPELFGGPR